MALELAELRERIAAAGLGWAAEETPISGRLVEADGIGLFGLNMSAEEALLAKRSADWAQRNFLAASLPQKIDWRNHHGANWLSPIRDQQACGACVAFATVGVMEARIRIQEDDAKLPVELSPAHLFFCGAGKACTTGWTFEAALLYLRDGPGVGLEANFPYRPRSQACKAIASVAKVLTWDTKSAQDARKQAIVVNGPVIAGLRVFEDFGFYKGGVYKHVAGAYRGLHAVGVVGYDDIQQAWIVRNSWNSGWGDQGYALVGYGECGIDTEFVYYDPEPDYRPAGFP